MAGTRDTYRIARVALTALAGMLAVSIAITFLIGASQLSTAEAEASDGARVLVQENLASIATGADLAAPVDEARAAELGDLIDGTILNGEVDAVTIWDPDGTIVYSTDANLIGTRLPEERFRLREVLKTGTDSTVQDGMFSTRVPLAPEGTDAEAVAQLDRVYAPIWDATAKPWRTASLCLSLVFLLVLGAIYQASRMASRRWKVYAGTTFQAIRGRRAPELGGGDGTDPAYTQPDFRRAEEELARAEVRATTAEERAAALQEQYRKTLEELHAANTKLEGAALETPSRPDPEIEERLLKAEGRVRLLEGQLQSVKTERDRLASEVQEHPAGTAPDPKVEQRARDAEAEAATLRTELETARHEVAGVVKELEATRREREQLAARTADAGQHEADATAARAEAERTRKALDTAKAELATASTELQAARKSVEDLQRTEQRAVEAERRVAQLDDRSRALEADLAQARAVAEGRVGEAQAAAETMTAEARAKAERAEARVTEAEARLAEADARAAQEAERIAQIESRAAEAEGRAAEADSRAVAADARVAQIEEAFGAKVAETAAAATEEIQASRQQAAEEAHAAREQATEEARIAREQAAAEISAAQERAAADIRAAQEQAAEDIRIAREEAAAALARRAEIEAAATSDVHAAVARMDEAGVRAAELQEALEAARREAVAARAEAESLRATVGTERAELEDAFRAELETRERELQTLADSREQELRAQVDEELQALADRLADAETQAGALTGREQQLVGHLEARDHDLVALRTREAELVAEMAALQEEVRAELEEKEQELRTVFAAEQTASFAQVQAATEADRARFETDRAELEGREASLRAEVGELRASLEQATAGLDTTGSDLESARAEVARLAAEADGAKAELQTIWAELEAAQQELTSALDQVSTTETNLQAALGDVQALRDGSEDADGALRAARDEAEQLRRELTDAREDLARTQTDVQAELDRGTETAGRIEAAERELQEASMRAAAAEHEVEQLHREIEISGHELATLREIAAVHAGTSQEREALEEMLRVTQEHLSGSNDRAAEVEQRAADAEQALATAREQVEELESRLRQVEMSQAVKAMRREDSETGETEAAIAVGIAAPIEDRRAGTPFMKELSLDAKKSLTSILGLSLTLKHKNQPKEQAPLLRQLAAYARRLDHTVADLLDADRLARGEVELHPRRTDLEALVERVVEESQAGNDHDVRLQTERIIASVDPVRTEQILMGLLRGATDRTPLGSAITIRLTKGEGGALISVEDAETSSDASLSPVVARFADVQGGWAKVESRPNGGSAFRVFLPAEGIMPDSPAEEADPEIELSVSAPRTGLEIVVSDELDQDRQLAMAADDDDPWAAGQLLVQELQKLSRDD